MLGPRRAILRFCIKLGPTSVETCFSWWTPCFSPTDVTDCLVDDLGLIVRQHLCHWRAKIHKFGKHLAILVLKIEAQRTVEELRPQIWSGFGYRSRLRFPSTHMQAYRKN